MKDLIESISAMALELEEASQDNPINLSAFVDAAKFELNKMDLFANLQQSSFSFSSKSLNDAEDAKIAAKQLAALCLVFIRAAD